LAGVTPTSNSVSVRDLARMIDHSLLHPTMTDAQLGEGLAIARRCSCATACVKPYAVPMSAAALAGSEVAVCAVVGFPHGNSHPELIKTEAIRAIGEGATEIDMVANAGKVLGGDWSYVADEIQTVNTA
jgi:deoxyribose-phosphate aldolase